MATRTANAVIERARRPSLTAMLVGGGLVTLIILSAVIAFRLLQPDADGRSVSLGSIERFEPGTVRSFVFSERYEISPVTAVQGAPYYRLPQSRVFHVARLPDGELLAFSASYPHPNGCTVAWLPDFRFPNGETRPQFRDPCLGSSWTMTGERISGPAPRNLDRYDIRVVGGQVFVDLTAVTPGESRVQPAPRGGPPVVITPAPAVPDPRPPSPDR